MKTKDPDQAPKDTAQGHFQDFGHSDFFKTKSEGELGEFSSNLLGSLGRTIENDLIPRLMLAFDTTPHQMLNLPATDLADHVEDFVQLLVEQEADIAVRYVETLRAEGIPLATLYLDLLAPSARRLGEMWEDDSLSFADVTIGVCRMHQVLLEFSRCFDASDRDCSNGHNAFIAPAPGEQHTFGLFMVMEFLRREGWTCFSGSPGTRRDFLRLAAAQRFDLIGLSVSADRNLDETSRLIADLKRNSDATVLVGGRCFLDHPELVKEVGADAMARDGKEAVRIANGILRKTAGNSPGLP
ncbi:MAG: cobalamin-dependent protein [Pseudomonadota bacterium]